MTIAIEWIRGEVPVKGERSKKCDSMGHKKNDYDNGVDKRFL